MATNPARRNPPTTFAQRVREARLDAGLSQSELARQIKVLTKSKVTKSLVSQWETGKVLNPQVATLDALAAVTKFTHRWLSTGKGPKKVDLDEALEAHRQAQALDRQAFARAVEAVVSEGITDPTQAVRAALELYDVLVESPDTSDAVLRRLVRYVKD